MRYTKTKTPQSPIMRLKTTSIFYITFLIKRKVRLTSFYDLFKHNNSLLPRMPFNKTQVTTLPSVNITPIYISSSTLVQNIPEYLLQN